MRPANGQRLGFRTYSQAEGLTNAWASCLQQDASGFILVCTEHGLFAYDGRHFLNLGPKQGLPDGGFVHALTFDARGRIILRYSHSIFVAEHHINDQTPPYNLRFHVARSVNSIDDDERGQIVPWRDGAIFAAQGRLFFVHTGSLVSTPSIEPAEDLSLRPIYPLQNATPLASDGTAIWLAQSDGGICRLSAGTKLCFGLREGVPNDNWAAFLVLGNGHLLARSASRLVEIVPATGEVRLSTLPEQGGRYTNYPHRLFLAETPSGGVLTQSAEGLMIQVKGRWQMLTAANGLPTVPILSVLFDHEKGLWLGVLGKGVLRTLGYGMWESLDHRDGLSNDVVWQMARQPDGPLWVANDEGVDAIGELDSIIARRHFDKPSFAIATDQFGHLWRSEGSDGIYCVTLRTGKAEYFRLPEVDKILHGAGSRLWFITEHGLYLIDDAAHPKAPQLNHDVTGPLATAVIGADGSLWIIRKRQLIHLHLDGTARVIDFAWPASEFEPLTLAISKSDIVWVGGVGGDLYRLSLNGDSVANVAQFGPPDIVSNTIVSLFVDSRDWVWVGTDNGLSVFDGKRWVSANTDDGLIWNDLDQGSVYEDTDGSMWFGTSQGISHILEPTRLFQQNTLRPVITLVRVGEQTYNGRAVSFSRDSLLVQFGIINFQIDGEARFRYKLDGVDKDWAETASGYARYPSVPPGHHLFEVVAYDPLTNQVSRPVSVLLRMRQPWWLWWPLITLYGLSMSGAVYGLLCLRTRMLLQQRRYLEREVKFQTKEILQAQNELKRLATQDNLTKLLTRGEAQSRLDQMLANGDRSFCLTVGLLDVDHFKSVNDRFGHLAGDEILREIGHRLRQALRPNDYAGRYGGEEILIVLCGSEASNVEQIRVIDGAVCDQLFLIDSEMISITCSIGVTHVIAHDDWRSVVGRADDALYKAKAQGRDRIVVSEAMAPV